MYDSEELDALIVQGEQEMNVTVPTVPTEDLETDHALVFSSALVSHSHCT